MGLTPSNKAWFVQNWNQSIWCMLLTLQIWNLETELTIPCFRTLPPLWFCILRDPFTAWWSAACNIFHSWVMELLKSETCKLVKSAAFSLARVTADRVRGSAPCFLAVHLLPLCACYRNSEVYCFIALLITASELPSLTLGLPLPFHASQRCFHSQK